MGEDDLRHKVCFEATAHIKCCICGMWWHIHYAVYLLLEVAICPVCGATWPLDQIK